MQQANEIILEVYHLLGFNAVQPGESQQRFLEEHIASIFRVEE
jgi:hypothetical protein